MKYSRNPWKLLNVSKDATQEEIKKAYKIASLKHHPDRGGNEELFKAVNDAYRKLKTNSHIPIVESKNTRLVNVDLTPAQQILGLDGLIEIGNGQTLQVKIPPGSRKDDRYSIKTADQTVILNIRESSDDVFTRQGNSLIMNLHVDIVTAMRGGQIEITAPSGECIQIDIDPGVKNGEIICIPEQGLFHKNRKQKRGNLHCVVCVDIPVLNTQEQIDNFITRLNNDRN